MSLLSEGERRTLIRKNSDGEVISNNAQEEAAISSAATGENAPNDSPVLSRESAASNGRAKQQPRGSELDYRSIDPDGRPPQSAHKADLTMSSRERLDMDTGGSSSLFKRKHGCFVQHWVGVLFAAFFITSLLLVGLLVGFLAPGRTTEGSTNPGVLPVEPANKTNPLRLPRSLVPENYRVRLQPFLQPGNFTFAIELSVTILCIDATDNITLNINNITINAGSVSLANDANNEAIAPKVNSFETDTANQFLVVKLDGMLTPKTVYRLNMKGVGLLNDLLVGFYKNEYKDGNETKYLAVTQFEPTDARRAFPCFDEPALKATFDITIVREANMTAISNGPSVRNDTLADGWIAETFETTPKMSTYLVAIVVSNFGHIDSNDSKCRVWAREDVLPTASYALEIAPKIIDYYNSYFGIPYPMNKTDLIAIPDFNAGAMENWGLITFRETVLLYDPLVSSASEKQSILITVAHELGHQWFGNLVTPTWWDDLWLNEGFATYMEYVGSNETEPTWNMLQQFVVNEVQYTMQLDSLKTSHPILVTVSNPDEINEIFDGISYGKGGSIIRMMEKFLGTKAFSAGLTNYLNDNKYSNADSNNLWSHLQAAYTNLNDTEIPALNVSIIMNKWAKQTGFPVVYVDRNYNDSSANITQKRFLLDSTNATNLNETALWDIPLTWAEQSDNLDSWSTNTKLWLHDKNAIVSNLTSSNENWLIFNIEEVGFYRVNYDVNNWKMLINQLNQNHTKINVVNRAQIIDDAFNLGRSGELPYEIALNTTLYLIREQDYIPWSAALGNFGFLGGMLRRSDYYGQYQEFVLYLIKPTYEKYGWTNTSNESVLTQYSQLFAINWACKYGYSDCVTKAVTLFNQWKSDPNNRTIIHQNLRSTVYCIGIAKGNYSDWQTVWEQYKIETIPSQKRSLMRALSCSSDMWVLSRYLRSALNTSSGIRSQDALTVVSQVASTDYGRELTFNFVRDQWNTIYTLFGLSTFSLSDVISTISGNLNTPFELKEFQEFWKSVKSAGQGGTAKRAFLQGIETAQANVMFMHNYYDTITSWLGKVLKNVTV